MSRPPAALSQVNNSPPSVSQVRIGHYWGLDGVSDCASNPGGNVYTDDVYVDNSIARVMLGNAETFGASTKRIVQVAKAWSNTEVTYTANLSRFTAGEKVYEFVIDASNNVRSTRTLIVQ